MIYKIGGWADVEGSPPGANELMHWTGINWAHDAGYRYYDFEGISVEVAQAVRDGHSARLGGVAFFKLGFGGDAVLYPGTYDLIPGGLTGRALRLVLPHAERWRVGHRLAGRVTDRAGGARRRVHRKAATPGPLRPATAKSTAGR